MSATLSDQQKDYFVEMAESSLNDLCSISHVTSIGKSSLKEPQYTRETFEDIPCGISFASLTYKNEINQAVILTADAILRLKKSQTISANDLVECRNKSFTVDGIYEGLTLKIIALKSMVTNG